MASVSTSCSPLKVAIKSASVEEGDLDAEIAAAKLEICRLRKVPFFEEAEVEEGLREWRELLHEYNETKDACQYALGQLAHLKMTTVKELYRHYDLDPDS